MSTMLTSRETLDKQRRRRNVVLMLVLAVFVIAVYAASFRHLKLESNEGLSPKQAGGVTEN